MRDIRKELNGFSNVALMKELIVRMEEFGNDNQSFTKSYREKFKVTALILKSALSTYKGGGNQ